MVNLEDLKIIEGRLDYIENELMKIRDDFDIVEYFILFKDFIEIRNGELIFKNCRFE